MPNSDFLSIKKATDIPKLHEFLEDRGYNFIRRGRRDKLDQPMIGLQLTQAGHKAQNMGLIVCANDDLYNLALEIVEDSKLGKAR